MAVNYSAAEYQKAAEAYLTGYFQNMAYYRQIATAFKAEHPLEFELFESGLMSQVKILIGIMAPDEAEFLEEKVDEVFNVLRPQ